MVSQELGAQSLKIKDPDQKQWSGYLKERFQGFSSRINSRRCRHICAGHSACWKIQKIANKNVSRGFHRDKDRAILVHESPDLGQESERLYLALALILAFYD